MTYARRIAPSLTLLAALGGCVFQSDFQRFADERNKERAKLEQRIAELEQKGPMHDQKFYDRVIADTNSSNAATRAYAEELAGQNKTYLEDQTRRLVETQESSRTALSGIITADQQRNRTARTELSIQLQDLQDRLDEWRTIIGDAARQSGIYGDRRRAQEEAERLTRAYQLIGDIKTALTTSDDTRAAAQTNYETFRAQTREHFTALNTFLADSTKTDAQKIEYIQTRFIPQIAGAYSAHQQRQRARPEAERR